MAAEESDMYVCVVGPPIFVQWSTSMTPGRLRGLPVNNKTGGGLHTPVAGRYRNSDTHMRLRKGGPRTRATPCPPSRGALVIVPPKMSSHHHMHHVPCIPSLLSVQHLSPNSAHEIHKSHVIHPMPSTGANVRAYLRATATWLAGTGKHAITLTQLFPST